MFIAKVDWPPLDPYVTVTELVKLKGLGLLVSTKLTPPPEKLFPAPPVKEPRLISELPLNNEKAAIVPVVVPPTPVDTPILVPAGLVKPSSVSVSVSDPAPAFLKKIDAKSRNAIEDVPGAFDPPVVKKADQEEPIMPPE